MSKYQSDEALMKQRETTMDYTDAELKKLLKTAREAGKAKAEEHLNTMAIARATAAGAKVKSSKDFYLWGDMGACGFAWVTFEGIKGTTKQGRQLKRVGLTQNWARKFDIWNPSGLPVQSVEILERGAYAAAEVLSNAGFNVRVHSRLD